MNRIETKEDLPHHIKIFATVLEGELSEMPDTRFFEAESITEFEINAHEIGYEIVPTLDSSTGRGFLVGFNATDSKLITTGLTGVGLDMYFIEVTETELDEWTAKIKQHREDQEQDMLDRRKRTQAKLKKRSIT